MDRSVSIMNARGELNVGACGRCWTGRGASKTVACVACAVSGIAVESSEMWFLCAKGHEKVATYKINVAFGGIRPGKPL